MRTSELTGALLDLWVAHAEGMPIYECGADSWPGNGAVHCEAFRRPLITVGLTGAVHVEHMGNSVPYTPSTSWAQGGPIIERERMNFATIGTGPKGENGQAPIVAIPENGRRATEGPTYLAAAMRAYVASKFGDEVDDAPSSAAGKEGGDGG